MERPPLWDKQKDAIRFGKSRGDNGVGLFMEMGTGKSRVMVNLIQTWIGKGARLGYIVAPISGLYVWPHEWKLWGNYPVLFVDLTVERVEGLKKAIQLSDEGWPVICLINYELAWTFDSKVKKVMRKGQEASVREYGSNALFKVAWDFGILDESQKIKTRGSKASQFFRNRMKKVTGYRAILTGSAYVKRPLDVWAQVEFAMRENVFGTFEDFAAEYATPHPHIRGAFLGYRNLDKLAQKLSTCCILLKKEDVLDLPPAVHITKYVDLSPEARKVYDELRKNDYAELEAFEAAEKQKAIDDPTYMPKAITADHIFTKTLRLRQLTSGLAQLDEEWDETQNRFVGGERRIIDKAKIDTLIELLEERDRITLIVVQWDFEEKLVSDALFEHFKVRPKILNGAVKTPAERHALVASMENDRFAIIKEEVGCRSMDMRFSDLTIFFSHREATEAYDQMLSRNHRGGQTKPITYVHLVARRTVDEKVLATLNNDLSRARVLEGHWREFLAD